MQEQAEEEEEIQREERKKGVCAFFKGIIDSLNALVGPAFNLNSRIW